MTPAGKAMEFLARQGYIGGSVEITRGPIRRDWIGCVDVLMFHPEKPWFLGIQATSSSNVASRAAKIQHNRAARLFLEHGNRLEVWGFTTEDEPGDPPSRAVAFELRAGTPIPVKCLVLAPDELP